MAALTLDAGHEGFEIRTDARGVARQTRCEIVSILFYTERRLCIVRRTRVLAHRDAVLM